MTCSALLSITVSSLSDTHCLPCYPLADGESADVGGHDALHLFGIVALYCAYTMIDPILTFDADGVGEDDMPNPFGKAGVHRHPQPN